MLELTGVRTTIGGAEPGTTLVVEPQLKGILKFGTGAAVGLAGLCIAGAGLLCWKIVSSSLLKSQDELMIRLLLSVTAVFIGMAFACLGFGLFLMRAQGSFGASGGDGTASAALWTNAPGLVVVVCATVVIALSLNVSWTRRNYVPTTDDVVTAPSPPPATDEQEAALGLLDLPNPYAIDASLAPPSDGGN